MLEAYHTFQTRHGKCGVRGFPPEIQNRLPASCTVDSLTNTTSRSQATTDFTTSKLDLSMKALSEDDVYGASKKVRQF